MAFRFSLPFVALVWATSAQAQTLPASADGTSPATLPATQPGTAPNPLTGYPPTVAAPLTYQPGMSAPPTADCVPTCAPSCLPCPTGCPGCRVWGGAEYLLWWVQGQRIPALVTTSPAGTAPGQAGVMGVPGTSVLFGDSRLNDAARSGVRLSLGMWLDDCHTCGIGGEFFILANQTDSFTGRSTGLPILARPFINVLNGLPDAQIVAYPGLANGGISASAESQLLGASGFVRHVLCCGCDYSVDALAGYRYLNLDERVSVAEQVQTAPGVQPQANFLVADAYQAQNQFHGGDIGLAAQLIRGRFSFGILGKLGIGANVRDVTITGSTGISTPGAPPANFNGGLLTTGRTGHFSDCAFALVPELRLGVGYQLSRCVRLTVGYNIMWWTNVARAGDQVNLAVNPQLLAPPLVPVAYQAPAIRDSTLWIQGLTAGLIFNY